MYEIALPLHSYLRWLLFACLLYCVVSAVRGVLGKHPYTRLDNIMRSCTSGFSHVQLLLGMVLYMKSPITRFFMNSPAEAWKYLDIAYFSVFHISMMLLSVVLITIGAAKARRMQTDADKHRQILIWFSIAIAIIFIAIPWPWNPYASRPLFRTF